jgi:TolA-binding protein
VSALLSLLLFGQSAGATGDPLAPILDLAAQDPRGAVAALAEVPAGAPQADRADYEAARITDRQLRDLVTAEKRYRQHARLFPQSPFTAGALARADYLRDNAGDDPQALAEFEAVADAWGERASPALEQRMAQVALQHPRSPVHARALFWLARVRLGAGDETGAIRWLDAVVAAHPGGADSRLAELQEADAFRRSGHYARALAIDRRFIESDDPLARELARGQLESTLMARREAILNALCLGLLVATTLGLGLGLWRRHAPLWPVAWEVKLSAPITGLFGLITLIQNRRVGAAVLDIAFGGAVLAQLNGAYLRRVTPRGIWRFAYLAALSGSALSLGYCAVQANHLTELVLTTLKQGADR